MTAYVLWTGLGLILYLQCLTGQRNNWNNQQRQQPRPNPTYNYYANFLTNLCTRHAVIPAQAAARAQECVTCFNTSLPCARGQPRPPFDFARARQCVDTYLIAQLSPCGNLLMGTGVSNTDPVNKIAFYACLRAKGWAETVNTCLVNGVTGSAFLNCTSSSATAAAARPADTDVEIIRTGTIQANSGRRVKPGGTPVELPARPPFNTGSRQGRDVTRLQNLRLVIEQMVQES